MIATRGFLLVPVLFLGLHAGGPHDALSAPLPKSTHEVLKKLKLDPALLAGTDKELQVPPEWIEGAKKEGALRVLGLWDPPQAEAIFVPFKERYPFIAIEYSRASREDRVIRTLVAWKNKRVLTDVLAGFGGGFFMYKEAGAMEDLRNIPNVRNIPAGTFDPEGLWVGMHMRHWCLAYNTNLVKEKDLPKKWEDLLTNPTWRNGNLALGNRPQLWVLALWKVKGEKWTKDFLTRLFTEVKPQIRKEGMNALVELTGAGEFHASVPAGEYRVYQKTLEGAPLSYTCPEPVPVAVSEMGILKGSPNINAARLFVNWFLSTEGQIIQYAEDFAPPVHKNLRRKEFLPFAEQILGKQSAFRDPEIEVTLQPILLEFWNTLWLKGGGKAR